MKEKRTGIISVLALLFSAVALGLAVSQWISDSPHVGQLDRIEELEREVAYLKVQAGGAFVSGQSRTGLNSSEYSENGDAGTREDEIEEMRWTMTVRGLMPATPAHVERAKRVIFSSDHNYKSKLAALNVLRRADQMDDDSVREMIKVFHESDDYRLQEDVLEVLDGVTTPELAPTLLKLTANSPNYRVRRQALDAMSGFLPDPKLEDWLRIVRKNDGNTRVREEADRLLKQYGTADAE